jgi:PST family polysaccharide transporter
VNLIPAFIRRRIAHRPNLIKIVDNISWLFFDKILRMGVGLIVGVWIARYLGPEQFGLLSYATAFVGLFSAMAGLGLQGIVVRDIVREPGGKKETLGTTALLQLIGGLLAYGLTLGTIFLLRPDDSLVKALVAILGSVMLFKASEVAVYWFESQLLSKYIVWVQNGCFLVFAAIKLVLIKKNAQLIDFAWAIMGEALVVALLMLVMLGLRGPRLRQLRINLLRAKVLLTDSWPLFLSGISIVIYMKIDQIMLGQMLGGKAVGIYSVAVRISEVWSFIPMMIVASVFPAIVAAKERSETHYYQRIQQLYDLMVWLSVGVALPMTFLSTPIVTLLFGDAFAESGPILAIHIWTTVFIFLGVSSGKWLIIEELQLLALKRNIYGAMFNIVLNLILIPYFHALGAAIASLISCAIAYYVMDAFDPRTKCAFNQKTQAMLFFLNIRKEKG